MLASRPTALALVTAGLVGCSAGGGSLEVGKDVGTGGAPGFFENGGAPNLNAVDASSSNTLSAHVESPPGMTVTFVTLSCKQRCADVLAVATGGFEPYSYRWEDGSTNPGRHVCPTASTSYAVTATDAGSNSGEFHGAQTVTVPLGAHVVACPLDGGADHDSGAPMTTGPCETLAAGFAAKGVNPNGPWSYGWSNAVGSPMTLYPTFIAQDPTINPLTGPGFPSIAQWYDPALGDTSETGPVPDIQFNPLSTAVHPGLGNLSGDSWIVGPGEIVMAPTNLGTTSSVARWTASTAGTYIVKAAFASAAGTSFTQTADVHVQRDGADLPSASGSITTTSPTFSFEASVAIKAGDTIDFVVAPPASIAYHMTAVDAAVCTVAGTAAPAP